MRRPLVAGNWKMNKTTPEAAALVQGFARSLEFYDQADVVLCPSYISIPAVASLLKGSRISVGAQDVFWMQQGAFTGEISAPMLKDAGVKYCIVGHSERRGRFGKLDIPPSTVSYFGETDETVRLKLESLVYCAITPILCVGETLEERETGRTDQVIASQLRYALGSFDPAELHGLVIAYEPVWAIGTGKTCDTAEAQRVCSYIRDQLGCMFEELREPTRILYGGSVKAANARDLFSQPDIDGGLVGGASLDAQEFKEIVMCAK